MPVIACDWCGTEFEKFHCHIKRTNHHFCCQEHHVLWQKGRSSYERTPEHRAKMSLIVLSNTEKMQRQGARLREYNQQVKKGRTWEQVYGREKAAKLRKHYSEMMRGENNPNFGNHVLAGENNPNWRGGICREPYGFEFDEFLKEQIRQRDDYICQLCGISQDEHVELIDDKLSVHHIDYDKTNNVSSNLISLCKSCHSKTNHNREYHRQLFTGCNECKAPL